MCLNYFLRYWCDGSWLDTDKWEIAKNVTQFRDQGIVSDMRILKKHTFFKNTTHFIFERACLRGVVKSKMYITLNENQPSMLYFVEYKFGTYNLTRDTFSLRYSSDNDSHMNLIITARNNKIIHTYRQHY